MAETGTKAKTGTEYGPVGYIYHLSSRRAIGPSGGSTSPAKDTELVVYDIIDSEKKEVLQFRFVCVKEFGHFGYIEHKESNKIVHPTKETSWSCVKRRMSMPYSHLIYTIIHRNGKHWHINGDDPTPKKNTACLLQKHEVGSNEVGSKDATINDAAKFYFGDIDAHHLYPYSSPNVSHDWKLLQAFITPEISRSFEINYEVGWVKEFSETCSHRCLENFSRCSIILFP